MRNHVATEVCSSPSACHRVAVGAIAFFDGLLKLHSHICAVVERRQHSRFWVRAIQRHVLWQLFVEDGCRFVDDGDDLLVAVAVAAGILNVPVARHRVTVGAVAGHCVRREDDLHLRTVVRSRQHSRIVRSTLQGHVARQHFVEGWCLVVFDRDDLIARCGVATLVSHSPSACHSA